MSRSPFNIKIMSRCPFNTGGFCAQMQKTWLKSRSRAVVGKGAITSPPPPAHTTLQYTAYQGGVIKHFLQFLKSGPMLPIRYIFIFQDIGKFDRARVRRIQCKVFIVKKIKITVPFFQTIAEKEIQKLKNVKKIVRSQNGKLVFAPS